MHRQPTIEHVVVLLRVRVNQRARYAAGPDPHHDLLSVNRQLFGNGPLSADPAPMNGKVWRLCG